jgi:NAD-reducing hydrogenase small subunit
MTSEKPKQGNSKKLRLATAWLGGCSGCHMSFLDLDEKLIDLFSMADLVYSPIADPKEFPENVDIVLVEGAVANVDHVKLAQELRARSKLVVSFGDCAVTGNVTSLRNRLQVDDLLTKVYHEGPGSVPQGDDEDVMPELLQRVIPLHQLIDVDAYIPGCPPDPERIWAAVSALINGEKPELEPEMRMFG